MRLHPLAMALGMSVALVSLSASLSGQGAATNRFSELNSAF